MFIPDQRNLGGRQIICNMIWNHRLSLNVLDEKLGTSPIQTKLHTPRIGCQTERFQSKPALFFRRIPSNRKQHTELLSKQPLCYPTKNQKEKFIFIDWDSIQNELKGTTIKKLPIFIRKVSKQISKEYDFATLIEMILEIHPKAKQEELIEIVSEIIVNKL